MIGGQSESSRCWRRLSVGYPWVDRCAETTTTKRIGHPIPPRSCLTGCSGWTSWERKAPSSWSWWEKMVPYCLSWWGRMVLSSVNCSSSVIYHQKMNHPRTDKSHLSTYHHKAAQYYWWKCCLTSDWRLFLSQFVYVRHSCDQCNPPHRHPHHHCRLRGYWFSGSDNAWSDLGVAWTDPKRIVWGYDVGGLTSPTHQRTLVSWWCVPGRAWRTIRDKHWWYDYFFRMNNIASWQLHIVHTRIWSHECSTTSPCLSVRWALSAPIPGWSCTTSRSPRPSLNSSSIGSWKRLSHRNCLLDAGSTPPCLCTTPPHYPSESCRSHNRPTCFPLKMILLTRYLNNHLLWDVFQCLHAIQ